MRNFVYCLGTVIFGNGNHFCNIALDPVPLEDQNVSYDGILRINCCTNLVSFHDFYKEVVGDYDINQLIYIRQKSTEATELSFDSTKPSLN